MYKLFKLSDFQGFFFQFLELLAEVVKFQVLWQLCILFVEQKKAQKFGSRTWCTKKPFGY